MRTRDGFCFPRQHQGFCNADVNMDVVGIPLPGRTLLLVGHKLQMNLVQMEAVVLHLHEAVPGVLADDLIPVIGRRLFFHVCFNSLTWIVSRDRLLCQGGSIRMKASPSCSDGSDARVRQHLLEIPLRERPDPQAPGLG